MAITPIGGEILTSGMVRGTDRIDSNHILVSYETPTFSSRLFTMLPAGPTREPAVTHNMPGTVRDNCILPGSTFGIVTSLNFDTLTDVHCHLLDIDLGTDTITVQPIVSATNIPGSTLTFASTGIYGLTDTKALIINSAGWYCFVTRSGTTLTIESGSSANLFGATTVQVDSFIPVDDTACYLVYRQDNAGNWDSYVAKVDINTGANSLTLNPGLLLQATDTKADTVKGLRYDGVFFNDTNGFLIARNEATVTSGTETAIMNVINSSVTNKLPDQTLANRDWLNFDRISSTKALVSSGSTNTVEIIEANPSTGIVTPSGTDYTYQPAPPYLRAYGVFVENSLDWATLVYSGPDNNFGVQLLNGNGDFTGIEPPAPTPEIAEIQLGIRRIEGSVEFGGWKCEGVIYNDADSITHNQEISVYADVFGATGSDRNKLVFRGHITPNDWQRNFQDSQAKFTAGTAQEFMKRERIQGIFFYDTPSPGNQHQITDMKYSSIFDHCIGAAGQFGHCNLAFAAWPFEGVLSKNIDSANSSSVPSYDMKEGGFWTRMQELANMDVYYCYVDKTNTIQFIPHPMFTTPLPAPALTITADKMLEPLRIQPRDIKPGQVRINGTSPDGEQFSGKYPADPEGGEIYHKSGFVAAATTDLAAIAERQYRFETRSHTVNCRLAGPIGLYLELMDRVYMTYSSTQDGIDWTDKPFWIHGVTVSTRPDLGAQTDLLLEAEN